jgi:hypothetical protein
MNNNWSNRVCEGTRSLYAADCRVQHYRGFQQSSQHSVNILRGKRNSLIQALKISNQFIFLTYSKKFYSSK